MSTEKLTAAQVAEHLTYDDAEEIAEAYLSLGITASEDPEDVANEIQGCYAGEFSSNEEFARDMADGLGVKVGEQWPHYCIDWEYAAREIMYDYSEEGGYYFRNV